MTLTLVYGGTFDPVHNGHLQVVKQLIALFQDAVIKLVPCHVPPHRDVPAAAAEDRLEMLRLAMKGIAGATVDECEIRRQGPSYSVDTLREYRQTLGSAAPIGFVMGMDSWESLPTWHEWRQLTDLAHLVIVSRPGYPHTMSGELGDFALGKLVESPRDLLLKPAGCIYFATLQESDVSATRLRQVLRIGGETTELLPAPVADYISTRRLYESPTATG